MGKKKSFMRLWIALAVVFGVLLLVDEAPVYAQVGDCRIIRILGGAEAGSKQIILEPETLHINRNTCVIWTNTIEEKLVSVKFSEGKKCEANTASPTPLYRLDNSNCYVSSFVPFGGTSSLVFKEGGIYDYVVGAEGMDTVKGKIMVQ